MKMKNIMKTKQLPISRKSEILIQQLKNEVLIYDLRKNKAFCLNQTCAMVWNECDGKKSINEISKLLSAKLNAAIDEEFVYLALEQLKNEDLIENTDEALSYLKGKSRREIIRKIGYGSLIAFPMVSSVIAPTAVQAQSGCIPDGGFAGSAVGAALCANAVLRPNCCSKVSVAEDPTCNISTCNCICAAQTCTPPGGFAGSAVGAALCANAVLRPNCCSQLSVAEDPTCNTSSCNCICV